MKTAALTILAVSLVLTSCLETLNTMLPPQGYNQGAPPPYQQGYPNGAPPPYQQGYPNTAPQPPIQQPPAVASAQADRAEFMRIHNQARAEVGAPPLQWSNDLANFAQQWAEELARRDTMEHRSNNPYGENLAYGSNVDVAGGCRMWLAERSAYDGGPIGGRNFASIGHYTQMIWRNTTHVGFGVARNGRNTYVVANYSPAGNVIGQRP